MVIVCCTYNLNRLRCIYIAIPPRNYVSFLRPALITLIAIMTLWLHFLSERSDLVNKISLIFVADIALLYWVITTCHLCVCFIPANLTSLIKVFYLSSLLFFFIFHSRTPFYSSECIQSIAYVRSIKMKPNFFVNMVYQMWYFNSFTVSNSTDYLRLN